MPLASTLAVSLGPTIGRILLSIWLKENHPLKKIAVPLIDLVANKSGDRLVARRIDRQFETIGEDVAKSMSDIFSRDGDVLNENELAATVHLLADVLHESDISARSIVSDRFDATAMAARLIENSNSRKSLLNERGQNLFDRCIKEVTERIVRVSEGLPEFDIEVAKVLIHNDRELSDLVRKILNEIADLRKSVDDRVKNRNLADIETDYRRNTAQKLDQLHLFGIDNLSESSRRHKLSIAYISLELSASMSNAEVMAVDDLLSKSNRILVKGAAGSGKTTLLQWLGVKASESTFTGALDSWNDVLPVFIQLRNYVGKQLPTIRQIIDYNLPSISGEIPDGWIEGLMREGKGLMLIDGVDETEQSARHEVHAWLSDFVATFPESRYVITSRPTAVGQGWLSGLEFTEAELQDMDLTEVDIFIDHWHDAIIDRLQEDAEKHDAKEQAAHLKSVLRERRTIRLLATSPLLCAMICALHRDRNQEVPSDRIQLYEAACQMLIDKRDKQRKVSMEGYPNLTYAQIKVLLCDLAYWMMRNALLSVDIDRVDDRFSKKLKFLQNIPVEVTGESIRRLVVERTGIVHDPTPDKISFRHKTFQEYLAAIEIADQDDIEDLLSNAHDDNWSETIVMCGGIMNEVQRKSLLHGLIEKGDQERQHTHLLHMLAVACLDSITVVDEDIKLAVTDRLAALVPPTVTSDASRVARAGNLAIPYLKWRVGLAARTEVACLRTLGMIGGDAALDTIAGYAKIRAKSVVRELLRNYNNFDRAEYVEKVLNRMSPHELTVGSRSELDALQYLSSITNLTVGDNFALRWYANCHFLIPLIKMKKLDLGYHAVIKNAAFLIGMSELENLYLGGCTDPFLLATLSRLPKLESLTIRHVIDIGLKPATSEISIKRLHVQDCPDWRWVESMKNIHALSIGGSPHKVDIDYHKLGNLTTLTVVCHFADTLECIGNLKSLDKITELYLYGFEDVADISPLLYLTSLRKLCVFGFTDVVDWRLVGKLPNLRRFVANISADKKFSSIRRPRHLLRLPTVKKIQVIA